MCCERRLSKQIKLLFPITHTLNALINATITTKTAAKSRIKIADKNKTEFCFACVFCFYFCAHCQSAMNAALNAECTVNYEAALLCN